MNFENIILELKCPSLDICLITNESLTVISYKNLIFFLSILRIIVKYTQDKLDSLSYVLSEKRLCTHEINIKISANIFSSLQRVSGSLIYFRGLCMR